jgi:hypothetical protein
MMLNVGAPGMAAGITTCWFQGARDGTWAFKSSKNGSTQQIWNAPPSWNSEKPSDWYDYLATCCWTIVVAMAPQTKTRFLFQNGVLDRCSRWSPNSLLGRRHQPTQSEVHQISTESSGSSHCDLRWVRVAGSMWWPHGSR